MAICSICGTEFESKHWAERYCSDQCRKIAAKTSRAKWISKSGYREKDAARKRKARAEKRAASDIMKQIRAESNAQQAEQAEAERLEAIQLRASEGDPLAIMALRRREGGHLFSLDYWNAFARYETQQAERMGKTSKCTVNGYSVYDDLFAENVIDSLSRQEQIYIRLR